MPGRILEGQPLAKKIRAEIKKQVGITGGLRVEPHLSTILVGENAGSKAYLQRIHSSCADVGIKSRNTELPANTSQDQLEKVIRELGGDRTITGILLQLPLPRGLNEFAAISAIASEKDVDGLNPCNLGALYQKGSKLVPCTPKGVMVLLRYYGTEMAGKHAVIINRTLPLGRPLAQLLLNEDATVTTCHSKTEGLADISRQADILMTGIGRRSEFTVGRDMIKPGATVIDIGISSVNGKMVGDVDFDAAIQVASGVTPVPGGVGPMTVAMLLYNTLLTACLQRGVILEYNPEELRSAEPI